MVLAVYINYLLLATRVVLGYTVPAYLTFKAVEQKRTELMRDWAIYWLVIGFFVTLEFIFNYFLSWIPFFVVLKVALIVALWHSKTKGAVLVYERVLCPFLAQHEAIIDNTYSTASTKALDFTTNNATKAKVVLQKHATVALEKAKQYQQKYASPARTPTPSSTVSAVADAISEKVE